MPLTDGTRMYNKRDRVLGRICGSVDNHNSTRLRIIVDGYKIYGTYPTDLWEEVLEDFEIPSEDTDVRFEVPDFDKEYDGDLKLPRLIALRNEALSEIEKLDEAIALLRVQAVLRSGLALLRSEKEVIPRCDVAAEARRIKAKVEDVLDKAVRSVARTGFATIKKTRHKREASAT